jgi:hypothetical protein
MKTTTLILAALTVLAGAPANATDWYWGDDCTTGSSPAKSYEVFNTNGFSPWIEDQGDEVAVKLRVRDGLSVSPLPWVVYKVVENRFYRTKEACEKAANLKKAKEQAEHDKLNKYR